MKEGKITKERVYFVIRTIIIRLPDFVIALALLPFYIIGESVLWVRRKRE